MGALASAVLPLLATRINGLWYALPLIVVISLVYSATRHERIEHILSNATRSAAWICAFMLVIFAILYLVSLRL